LVSVKELRRWLAALEAALAEPAAADWAALFNDQVYWRDLVALTWNIVTLEGQQDTIAMPAQQAPMIRPRGSAPPGRATLG
jgi:putative flavoprotein involved in K+ transport